MMMRKQMFGAAMITVAMLAACGPTTEDNNTTMNNANTGGGDASCSTEGLDHSRVEDFFNKGMGNEVVDPRLTAPAEGMLPVLTPASGSPALSGFVDPGDAFFDTVAYRGAFGAENWLEGWANFSTTDAGDKAGVLDETATGTPGDNDAVDCDDAEKRCTISGTITSDLTLTPNYTYVLSGGVFVGDKSSDSNTVTLTVEPGVTIYGDTSALSFLAVSRGAKLEAAGTKEKPIIMTSANAIDGNANPGDWGGLIINGKAPLNTGASAEGEGDTGTYGGSDAADSSGTLKWLEVSFGGKQITSDNELNGIAFQGVGSGTEVDYVHVHMSKDDGVEFFGGTVNGKHIAITGVGDDNIDWTDGWTGKLQYVVAIQYEYDSDNGIEADNNGNDNSASPVSSPMLSNVTLIGIPDSSGSDLGLLLREGTAGKLYNMVVWGFNDTCLSLDQGATFTNAENGNLSMNGTILYCEGAGGGGTFCDLEAVAAASGN